MLPGILRSIQGSSMPARVSHPSLTEGLVCLLRRHALCAMAVVALGLLTGCGDSGEYNPTGDVTGKVSVKGQPLTAERINFVSDKGVGASSALKPDGTYTLEGALPVGTYSVFITFDISPAQRGTAAENVLKTVPEKYQAQATSGLTADLEEGRTEVNFDLK